MTQLWETIGTKLADRWLALAGPAMLYWTGGFLLLAASAEGQVRLTGISAAVAAQPAVLQVSMIAAAVLAVLASGVLVQRLTLPTLRLLAGYWPAGLAGMRRSRIASERARLERAQTEWMRLAERLEREPTNTELEQEYILLDARLRRLPAVAHRLLPTRLGNVLRSAESRTYDKYGLDPVRCFPHLWLLLPDAARQELAAARGRLDGAVAACVWGVFFLPWGAVNLLAVPVGAGVAVAAWWWWLPERAEAFGELLEATFDLYRVDLYEALRWPLPANPAVERQSGELLTRYVWRGLDSQVPVFTAPRRAG